MSIFEYLGVLLSVIMGLGVTHLLAGLSKMIHHRRTARIYWVHTLWVVNILINIVTIWWGMFWWSGLEDWSFFNFLLLTAYTIVLFLTASILFPWDLSPDFDFEVHFYETRPWFFSVFTVAWCIDIPETILKSDDGLRALPQGYIGLSVVLITLGVIGALWANRSYHKIYAVAWPVITVSYVSLTTLAQIAR